MLENMHSVVFWDTESTGLSTYHDHITQLASTHAVMDLSTGRLQLGPLTEPAFSALVGTERPIPPIVQRLTGITPAALQGQPPFRHVALRWFDWLRQVSEGRPITLVGHNSLSYDFRLLQRELHRHGLDSHALWSQVRVTHQLDTLVWARQHQVTHSHDRARSLPTTATGKTSYRLEPWYATCFQETFSAHEALADAVAVYRLLGAYGPSRPDLWASRVSLTTTLQQTAEWHRARPLEPSTGPTPTWRTTLWSDRERHWQREIDESLPPEGVVTKVSALGLSTTEKVTPEGVVTKVSALGLSTAEKVTTEGVVTKVSALGLSTTEKVTPEGVVTEVSAPGRSNTEEEEEEEDEMAVLVPTLGGSIVCMELQEIVEDEKEVLGPTLEDVRCVALEGLSRVCPRCRHCSSRFFPDVHECVLGGGSLSQKGW